MGNRECSVGVFNHLGQFILVGRAAKARALFRLFAFWLTHFLSSLKLLKTLYFTNRLKLVNIFFDAAIFEPGAKESVP